MTEFVPSVDDPIWVQFIFWFSWVGLITWGFTCIFCNKWEVTLPATAVALVILLPRLVG